MLAVWKNPITKVWHQGVAKEQRVSWVWYPAFGIDYFPRDVPLVNLFTFGASEYGSPDDEMYCPCGDTLPAPHFLGDRMDVAMEHVRTEHAETIRSRDSR